MPPCLQARRARPIPRAGVTSTFALGPVRVRRSGHGAVHLAGPFAFGPPPDRASAIGVLPGHGGRGDGWPGGRAGSGQARAGW